MAKFPNDEGDKWLIFMLVCCVIVIIGAAIFGGQVK
jgi:hypothetical protein